MANMQSPDRSLGRRMTWPALRLLRRNPVSFIAAAILVLLLLIAVLAPWVVPFGPDDTDPAAAMVGPCWPHLFGTDIYGRDELSRIIYAARVDLAVPLASTAIALVIGSLIGVLVGYRGGWLDMLIMRAVDAVLAFPALVLAMGLTAALGSGSGTLIGVIAITQVPTYLRLMRGEILRVREMEYAEAALTVGNPVRRILLLHLLPNCVPPLIVQATLATGFALLTMATLSYLGLGIQPPASEWGEMTAEGAGQMVTGEWWLFVFPGLTIMVTVLSFNLIGDALRDILDPRMRGVR
jgi:peptide/nickel transport system permease protein